MTAEEMVSFEERLKEDSALNEQFEEMKIINEGIRLSVLDEKLNLLKDLENKEVSEKEETAILGGWKKWLVVAILIGILSVVWIYVLTPPPGPSEKYAEMFEEGNWDKYVKHEKLRSTTDDKLSPKQNRAYDLYTIQAFEEAIPELEELWETQRDTLAFYYLGISYLGIGEDEKGEEVMSKEELEKFK